MTSADHSETVSEEVHADSPVKDESSLLLLVARDVALGAGLLSLFAAADAWHILTGSGLSGFLSIVDGFLVGLGISALAHEWGHYSGGRWSGARLPLKAVRSFPQVFGFDYQKCEARHFMGLSVGGNVGHWLMVILLAVFLPLDTTGQLALLSGSFGFAVFASTVEFPVIARARTGASPMESLSVISSNFLQKNGAMGAAAALVAFLVL
ncbi:MAG: hypothetical protein CL917_18250 [Deltaproteobacteria bacterium]|nr:hypothetical protein [Deltaproteobacteria bacterium]